MTNEMIARVTAVVVTAILILGASALICRLGLLGKWSEKATLTRISDILWLAFFLAWPMEAVVFYLGWKALQWVAVRVEKLEDNWIANGH